MEFKNYIAKHTDTHIFMEYERFIDSMLSVGFFLSYVNIFQIIPKIFPIKGYKVIQKFFSSNSL